MRCSSRGLFLVALIVLSGIGGRAEEIRTRSDAEPFPQSAKWARDRHVDAVFESARVALEKQDFAAGIAELQSLLNAPQVVALTGTNGRSVVAEANRLLAEMPAAGRALYEKLQGTQAERLWQEARQASHSKSLPDVVARFGQTNAGWKGLRDLAAWHFDRGEWALVIAASDELARHPRTSVLRETGWLVRWQLAVARQRNSELVAGLRPTSFRAVPHPPEWRQAPAPPGASQLNLSDWLREQSGEMSVLRTQINESPRELHPFVDGPAGMPSWQVASGMEGEPAEWLRDVLKDWANYDVAAIPTSKPLVVGDIVVSRFAVPAKTVAVDVRNGRVLWERSFAQTPLGLSSELQRHPGIRSSLFDELQRRWFGDSVRGGLTTDGRRLFAIQDADMLDMKPGSGTLLRNHLEALNLATGERLWRIGGSQTEPPSEFQGLYFLGPPLVSGHLLYVVAQREVTIHLLALRAEDGRLEWSLPLAETDRQQFKEIGWRHVACPVTWADGRLVCPTGAGCVVAVDPVLRTVAWSFRFEREDILPAVGFGNVDRERSFPARWWESWREVALVNLPLEANRDNVSEDSSVLIVASPESRSLRALNPRTGEQRWRMPIDEPLFLVANQAEANGTAQTDHTVRVLVFERNAVTAIDPRTGQSLWRTAIAEPAAAGDWIGGRYLFPLHQGGWSVVDLNGAVQVVGNMSASIGTTSTPVARKDVLTREIGSRLVRARKRWVSVSPVAIRGFEPLSVRQHAVAERLKTKPDDLEQQLQQASLAEQTGDVTRATELLRTLTQNKVHGEQARQVLRRLLLQQLERGPADHEAVETELLALSHAVTEQMESRHVLIKAARRSGDWETALRRTFDLLELHPADEVELDAEQPTQSAESTTMSVRRTVRRDRWLQGVVADLLVQTSAVERSRLEAIIVARRQRAEESLDPFALQQFAESLGKLSIGQSLKLSLSGRTGVGLGFVRTNLALREVAGASDRELAAQALYRLALLYEFRSEPIEAADCYRELRDRFADTKLPDGRSPTDLIDDVPNDSPIGRLLAQEPLDPWPTAAMSKVSQDEPHDDIYCHLIPVESRDSFWNRVSVSVERQGRKVRFHGAGQRGFWELPLPKSNSAFRHNFYLYRGWGLGPLLVLQVGRDLLGVQVLNDRGEPDAQLLWSLVLPEIDEIGGHEVRLGRLGFSTDDLMALDRYEHPVLEVVVARPGIVCYRHFNRLVAIDPTTGTHLWTRHGLPPRTVVTGDDEVVLVQMNESKQIDVLRAFDGRLLARRTDSLVPSSAIFVDGRFRLRATSHKVGDDKGQDTSKSGVTSKESAIAAGRLTLFCDDLATGRRRWQREFPAGSTPLRIDASRIGLLEPSGMLRFLALHDSSELAQQEIARPETVTRLHVFGDEFRLFVVVSGPVTETSWLATEQDRGGYRKPLFNGSLYAFDRRALRKLWSISTGNLPIALDQPKDVPFLLLSYKRPSDDSADGRAPDNVLHAIDKRTGKELLYEVGSANDAYFALDPNPAEGQVDLLLRSRRVRLGFGD